MYSFYFHTARCHIDGMHVKHVVTNEVQPAQSLTTCGGPKSPKTWDVATKSLRYLVVLLIPSSRSPFKMHGDNLFRTRILHRHIFLFMGSSSFTGTSSLHGHIFPFIGTSSLHGRIFPFIGTPSPSWAHLPLHWHIFPSWAHLPLHWHTFPFMGASSPSRAHPSRECILCRNGYRFSYR